MNQRVEVKEFYDKKGELIRIDVLLVEDRKSLLEKFKLLIFKN